MFTVFRRYQVEQETAHSMRTLTRLDTVKSRMERTCQALKEADNWTTLSADVEEVRDALRTQGYKCLVGILREIKSLKVKYAFNVILCERHYQIGGKICEKRRLNHMSGSECQHLGTRAEFILQRDQTH